MPAVGSTSATSRRIELVPQSIAATRGRRAGGHAGSSRVHGPAAPQSGSMREGLVAERVHARAGGERVTDERRAGTSPGSACRRRRCRRSRRRRRRPRGRRGRPRARRRRPRRGPGRRRAGPASRASSATPRACRSGRPRAGRSGSRTSGTACRRAAAARSRRRRGRRTSSGARRRGPRAAHGRAGGGRRRGRGARVAGVAHRGALEGRTIGVGASGATAWSAVCTESHSWPYHGTTVGGLLLRGRRGRLGRVEHDVADLAGQDVVQPLADERGDVRRVLQPLLPDRQLVDPGLRRGVLRPAAR